MRDRRSVFAIYRCKEAIEKAVELLIDKGFRNSDISVFLPASYRSPNLGHVKSTKAPKGAAAGAGPGAIIEGAVGGLGGALIGMGVPEYEAKRYEGHFENGGLLISVQAENFGEIQKAKEILRKTGGQDIAVASEGRDEDFNISDTHSSPNFKNDLYGTLLY